MKFVQFLLFFVIFYSVECKNHVKALTESMGQEVIEIGAPLKELPPGLEEEPSAENEETSKTASARRETKRIATTTSATVKDTEKEDTASQEEEEARIEKELAEIYKDTDYKSESTEAGNRQKQKISTVVAEEKPIARQRNKNFKFQPDVNNRADIERFRTSVDEITCEKAHLAMAVVLKKNVCVLVITTGRSVKARVDTGVAAIIYTHPHHGQIPVFKAVKTSTINILQNVQTYPGFKLKFVLK